ncbi:streptamidine-related RiPP repeat protein [Pseudofrankia sp. DC12]|uniref:streptamidine-related RiPP repeat protein n=1 Tax=Pseudofrankia sp. DC12 TaxID=683315 RepID=UPI0005F80116|nr:streptamidine-related RiPP repeat protein [Pseudofrankia sp. DC12]
MQDVLVEPVAAVAPVSAPQGPGTNALVHNPFVVEPVAAVAPVSAPQGPGTNALVHNPFVIGS